MKAYIVRRLINAIPIVFGVMMLLFVLFRVAGGDPSYEMAGKAASAETIAAVRHEYGFDKPLFLNAAAARERGVLAALDSQFFHYLWNSLTFNFGLSYQYRQSIGEMISQRAIPSVSLMAPMLVIEVCLALSIALLVAYVRGTVTDRMVVVVAVLGMSVPYLSYILFAQWLFAGRLRWFPILGYEPGWEKVTYLALPVLIGVVHGLGGGVRFYRTVVLDEIHADYVRTARAKGASTTRVLFKHVLKNAMTPVITQVVMAIPFLYLGSLLLERFFSIPGLGDAMVQAINSRDYPVISALTYIGALSYVGALLVTDICYALVDPRIELR